MSSQWFPHIGSVVAIVLQPVGGARCSGSLQSASAPDEPSRPTHPDAYHARVVLELRKSVLLNTRRVLCTTFLSPL